MLLIANAEAWPGFETTVEMLRAGADSLTAMVAGISRVEAEPKVRSVGYGGWPNMLGAMECDAAVMDGNTRGIGAVGAVPNTVPVAKLAHEVMKKLPHVMLTGDGARRFATEAGLRLVMPPAELCTDNGAMIAWTGIERLRLGLVDDMTFAARPRWPLDPEAEPVHHGKA